MPTYKLTYFDARGIAEPIRLIFAYAKVEFEDVRLLPPLSQEIKDKCPWGQVPLLEVDGKILVQSAAIARFLAKTFNLVGADIFEAAKCDEYVDTITGFWKDFHAAHREQDQDKKAELLKTAIDDVSKKYLTKFNDIVVANDGKGLVGKNLTWADIYLVHTSNNVEVIFNVNMLAGFPALKSLEETFYSVPQIKEWVEKRPKTTT